ncbi:MAG: hypothetical protein AAF790_10940, partial [Planctomycetota bacterium]
MPPELFNLFGRLRRRIRGVVAWRSAAGLAAGLGLAFWLGMAADWFFEPPPTVRLGMILAGGAAAVAWLARTLAAPLLRAMPDRELALLVEQRR